MLVRATLKATGNSTGSMSRVATVYDAIRDYILRLAEEGARVGAFDVEASLRALADGFRHLRDG